MIAYDAPEFVDFAESSELFREWAKTDMVAGRRPTVEGERIFGSGVD